MTKQLKTAKPKDADMQQRIVETLEANKEVRRKAMASGDGLEMRERATIRERLFWQSVPLPRFRGFFAGGSEARA
jgi:hypothetical protein